MPTYPSPEPTSTLTSHLGQNVGLGEGYHIMIRLFRALRFWGRRKSERHAKTWRGRRFYFFHVLSQVSRPDYLGVWNRLGLLQPRSQVGSLFPGFGGGRPICKAGEKRPGDEVVLATQTMSRQLQIRGGEVATGSQGFDLTAFCNRVPTWMVAFTVFGYVLSRLTDWSEKKSVILI